MGRTSPWLDTLGLFTLLAPPPGSAPDWFLYSEAGYDVTLQAIVGGRVAAEASVRRQVPSAVGVVERRLRPAKGGIYGNHADWQRVSNVGGVISDFSNKFTTFASTLETEVTGTVRLSEHCALRGGYQMLWINGLAFAMENLVAPNSADLLLLHGAFAGLEMRF